MADFVSNTTALTSKVAGFTPSSNLRPRQDAQDAHLYSFDQKYEVCSCQAMSPRWPAASPSSHRVLLVTAVVDVNGCGDAIPFVGSV